MDIFAICAVAVIAAVTALLMRPSSPQTALLISIGAGVVILLTFIRQIVLTADDIRAILEAGGISSENIMILLKTLGVCFVTEFTCDTVTEAGMLSLSTNLSFAGKLTVLFTALPLFRELIGLVSSLVNGS
jgi:stage III sporulation protein AD